MISFVGSPATPGLADHSSNTSWLVALMRTPRSMMASPKRTWCKEEELEVQGFGKTSWLLVVKEVVDSRDPAGAACSVASS